MRRSVPIIWAMFFVFTVVKVDSLSNVTVVATAQPLVVFFNCLLSYSVCFSNRLLDILWYFFKHAQLGFNPIYYNMYWNATSFDNTILDLVAAVYSPSGKFTLNRLCILCKLIFLIFAVIFLIHFVSKISIWFSLKWGL